MNGFEVRTVAEYEMDSWDEFVTASPMGTLFHTSIWRQLINSTHAGDTYELTGAWQDGELVAGYCALVRRRLGVLTAVTPLLTPYTGFVYRSGGEIEQNALEALTKQVRRYRYQNIQCAPGVTELQALKNAGYRITPRRTLEINLRLPEGEIWESFDGNVRRNIRKAEKAGYEINDQWDEDQGYHIFSATFARQGSECPVNKELFQAIADGAQLLDFRRRYVAWQDGKIAGFIIALRYDGKVYYELAATSDEARALGLSSFLIWELLRDHPGGEWEIFDFVGGNSPAIARFKEGFNPVVKPHLALELCTSKRVKLGRAMRDLLRRR